MDTQFDYKNRIYIATVLLEKNRWSKDKKPSFLVSDWLERFAEAGFDGIELWQYHALLASEEERKKLRNSPVPVVIFNSYARCSNEESKDRERSTQMVEFFSAQGMKFNFGPDPNRHSEYLGNARAWRQALPESLRFLCECHGGNTVEMDRPEEAAEAFKAMDGKMEAILHAFGNDDEGIKKRFRYLGEYITHVHACFYNRRVNLQQTPENVRDRVKLLQDLGFRGSFTIEFTEGVAEPDEDIDRLFQNAVRDMHILRECLE